MKILLAVDGSEFSAAATQAIAERPWPAGSTIRIISAVEPPFVPMAETWALSERYYPELEDAAEAQAAAAVNGALKRLQASMGAEVEIMTKVKRGRAEDIILQEAEDWGADLIVVGSHGYRGLRRLLLGSVSHTVATHAPCSVEIVRQKRM